MAKQELEHNGEYYALRAEETLTRALASLDMVTNYLKVANKDVQTSSTKGYIRPAVAKEREALVLSMTWMISILKADIEKLKKRLV